MNNKRLFVLFFLMLGAVASWQVLNAQNTGNSMFRERINDPNAVYLTKENFKVSANGKADDAPALQAAIDMVREKTGSGIVFIPEGTYRLGKTVYLWRGIRLIGYGESKPVFTLGKKTPGFQDGDNKYMVHFAHAPGSDQGGIQPGTWRTEEFIDGTWTTFYSGIYNIDFVIEDGNPAAIAVRYHVAQVCALENIDFNIGNGRGGVEDMGNLIERCTFRGGEFGIKTVASPPDWPVTVLDCTFENQRDAGMITNGARMLVIRGRFQNAPVGIRIPEIERLYVEDSWFENIEKSALVVNNFVPPQLQVNLVNVKLSNVPYSLRFSGRMQGWSADEVKTDFEAPATVYAINSFSHGLHIINPHTNQGSVAEFTSEMDQEPIESMGTFPSPDVSELPSTDTWVNILDLGAKGDGETDCTEIFEKAIATSDAIYIPMGEYVISKTLTLDKNTTLIGLQPTKTRLVLKNETPGFTDEHNYKPMIVAPQNGTNGIRGLGFSLGVNPGAIGIKWMAGENSWINDGHFGSGGSGAFGESQAHSIWVTNGGGGVFKNMWIVDRKTRLAFYVSDTQTPGKIYEISIEHHKDVEVVLDNVENWSFYGLQLEEDRGSEKTLGIYIKDSKNILFANFHSHRTTGVWEPYHAAIQIRNSSGITILGNEMRGAVFPFENAIFDEVTGMVVPYNFFTKLVIE